TAVVDYLLEFEPQASWVAEQLAEVPSLHAPHAVDVEVLATLRRGVLGSELSTTRARVAIDDFHALPMRRYPHKPFLERVWELRTNLTGPGAEITLGNPYHLHFRPGEAVIDELGGLHEFMQWDGPILTDSGGYQVFSLRDTITRVDDDGVTFRSVYDGASERFTPESVAA